MGESLRCIRLVYRLWEALNCPAFDGLAILSHYEQKFHLALGMPVDGANGATHEIAH